LPNEGEVLAARDPGIGHLFESIRDAVIVADANTARMVLWNPAAEEIFGHSTADPCVMLIRRPGAASRPPSGNDFEIFVMGTDGAAKTPITSNSENDSR